MFNKEIRSLLMERYNRKTVYEMMGRFSPTCGLEEYIEISEWDNGEGVDIDITGCHMSITYTELNAINVLCDALQHPENETPKSKTQELVN